MLGKESVGEVAQVGQQGVFLVGPVGSELKGVAVGLVFAGTILCFLLLFFMLFLNIPKKKKERKIIFSCFE